MRSTTIKWTLASLFCLLTTSFLFAQDMAAINQKSRESKPESAAPVAKYTGYWVIRSGADYFMVKEAELAPGLVTKNSKNQVENVDLEGLKMAMNFRSERQINGKTVEQNYFVIKDESGSKDMGALNPAVNPGKRVVSSLNHAGNNMNPAEENKVSGPQADPATHATYRLDVCMNNLWCQAICFCNQLETYQGWQSLGMCGGGQNYCMAYHYASAQTFIVFCNDN